MKIREGQRIVNVNISARTLKKAIIEIAKKVIKDMKVKNFNKLGTQEIIDQVKPQFKKNKNNQKIKVNMSRILKKNYLGEI